MSAHITVFSFKAQTRYVQSYGGHLQSPKFAKVNVGSASRNCLSRYCCESLGGGAKGIIYGPIIIFIPLKFASFQGNASACRRSLSSWYSLADAYICYRNLSSKFQHFPQSSAELVLTRRRHGVPVAGPCRSPLHTAKCPLKLSILALFPSFPQPVQITRSSSPCSCLMWRERFDLLLSGVPQYLRPQILHFPSTLGWGSWVERSDGQVAAGWSLNSSWIWAPPALLWCVVRGCW